MTLRLPHAPLVVECTGLGDDEKRAPPRGNCAPTVVQFHNKQGKGTSWQFHNKG